MFPEKHNRVSEGKSFILSTRDFGTHRARCRFASWSVSLVYRYLIQGGKMAKEKQRSGADGAMELLGVGGFALFFGWMLITFYWLFAIFLQGLPTGDRDMIQLFIRSVAILQQNPHSGCKCCLCKL